MAQPSVSIIIPCFNMERYLAESLRSVLAQTYPVSDIIVIDDGSTDASAAVAATFDGVRVIRQTNQGISAARNRGVSEAKGEYLIFLDADDRLLPDAVQIGVENLSARPECAFVYGFCRQIDAGGAPLLHLAEPEPVTHASYTTLLAGSGLVPPAAACHRRAAFETVGGFDPKWGLSQDHELYLRIARKFPIYCHNRVVVEWRQHGGSLSKRSAAAALKGVLATIEVQRPTFQGNREYEEAARRGEKHWARIFGPALSREFYATLKRGRVIDSARALSVLLRHYPRGVVEYPTRRLMGRPARPPAPAPTPAPRPEIHTTIFRAKKPSA